MKLFTKLLILLTIPSCFLLFSCGSTPKVEDEEIQTPEAIVVPEEPEEVIDDSDDVILIDEVVVDFSGGILYDKADRESSESNQ